MNHEKTSGWMTWLTEKSKQGTLILGYALRQARKNKRRNRVKRVASLYCMFYAARLHIRKDPMCLVAFCQRIEFLFMLGAEQIPELLIFLDDCCNNLVGLRKVIVQVDMSESFRNTTPAIDLLLGQSVDIVCNLLMGNQHQVHLIFSASIAFFCKVLKHLSIAYRCLRNVCFQILAELIVDDIDTRVAMRF